MVNENLHSDVFKDHSHWNRSKSDFIGPKINEVFFPFPFQQKKNVKKNHCLKKKNLLKKDLFNKHFQNCRIPALYILFGNGASFLSSRIGWF